MPLRSAVESTKASDIFLYLRRLPAQLFRSRGHTGHAGLTGHAGHTENTGQAENTGHIGHARLIKQWEFWA